MTAPGADSNRAALAPARGGSQVLVPILLGTVALLASSTTIDPNDTWWHLRSGEYYLHHWTVPSTDVFSHTAAGQPYYPHEWLSQVVLYLVHRWTGFVGIRVLNSLMAMVSVLLLWRFYRKATTSVLPILFAIAVIFPDFLSRLNTRPEIFTLPLFVAFLHFILHRDRSRLPGRRTIAAVAILAAVWANVHGMALLGLIYLLAYAAGQGAARLAGRFLPVPEWRSIRATGVLGDFILAGVYAVAACASPMGYGIYIHAVKAREFLPGPLGIVEWLSPFQFLGGILQSMLTRQFPWINIELAWQFVFLAIPLAYFFSIPILALRGRLPGPGEILIALLAIYQAASVVRFRWLFFILLYWIIRAASSRRAEEPGRREPATSLSSLVLHPIMLLLIASSAYIMLSRGISFRRAIDTERYPVGIANFLEDAALGGNLFNSYNWGGYLLFRLTPSYRVFIDGRTDLYSYSNRNLLLDHVAIENKEESYQELLDTYKVDVLISAGRIYFPGVEYAREFDFERRQQRPPLENRSAQSPAQPADSQAKPAGKNAGPVSPEGAARWIPILVNREGSVYLRRDPRMSERVATLDAFFAKEGITLTAGGEADLAEIVRHHPRLAVRWGILPEELVRGLIEAPEDLDSDTGIARRVELAGILIRLEFFRDAAILLEPVLKVDRYNNEGLMQIAVAHHLLGENDQAYVYLERSAAIGRNSAAREFMEHCRAHQVPPSERPLRLPPIAQLSAEWKSDFR